MTKREARKAGYGRGWNVASWVDMPAIGSRLPRDMDWVGMGELKTAWERIEAWSMLCSEAESNDRSYSPFEFTAHDINEQPNSDELWEAFEEGITAGINAYRRKHYKVRDLRREEKESDND